MYSINYSKIYATEVCTQDLDLEDLLMNSVYYFCLLIFCIFYLQGSKENYYYRKNSFINYDMIYMGARSIHDITFIFGHIGEIKHKRHRVSI